MRWEPSLGTPPQHPGEAWHRGAPSGTEGHRAAPPQRPPRLLLGRGCAHCWGVRTVTVGTPGWRGTAEAVSTRGHGRFAPRPRGVGLAARPRRARCAAALCRTPPAPGSQPRRDPGGRSGSSGTASPSPPRSAGGVLAPHQITARKPLSAAHRRSERQHPAPAVVSRSSRCPQHPPQNPLLSQQPGSPGTLQQEGPPPALPDFTEQWMCALDS